MVLQGSVTRVSLKDKRISVSHDETVESSVSDWSWTFTSDRLSSFGPSHRWEFAGSVIGEDGWLRIPWGVFHVGQDLSRLQEAVSGLDDVGGRRQRGRLALRSLHSPVKEAEVREIRRRQPFPQVVHGGGRSPLGLLLWSRACS